MKKSLWIFSFIFIASLNYSFAAIPPGHPETNNDLTIHNNLSFAASYVNECRFVDLRRFHFQATREQITIRWLAKALTRMGESKIAKRLMDDYFLKKRIHFGDISTADGNAETGPGPTAVNEITFPESMLNVADADRLLKLKPYGPSSPLIGYAMTVVHAYAHMDQDNPANIPEFEDPAWQVSDKTLYRWAQRIETEYNAVKKLPASGEKTAKLSELTDLIKQLAAESVTLKNSIQDNIANGTLSPDQRWMIDDTDKRISMVQGTIANVDPAAVISPKNPTPKTEPGFWELVDTQAFDKLGGNPGDNNYGLRAVDGKIIASWALYPDEWQFSCYFSTPPKQIRPTDKIPFNMSVEIDKNSGSQYSANGGFVISFDRPEIQPGSVIAPIYLKGDKGENSSIQLTHRQGIPPSPSSSLMVYIEGKNLPAGARGARIALMADVGIGRNAGYKYIYEWNENGNNNVTTGKPGPQKPTITAPQNNTPKKGFGYWELVDKQVFDK